jgi:hypothetical protein
MQYQHIHIEVINKASLLRLSKRIFRILQDTSKILIKWNLVKIMFCVLIVIEHFLKIDLSCIKKCVQKINLRNL